MTNTRLDTVLYLTGWNDSGCYLDQSTVTRGYLRQSNLNSPNNKINYTEMINLLLWIIISHLFLKKRKVNEDTLNESSFEYQLKQDYSFSNLTSSFSIFLISSSACKRTKKNNLRNCNLTDAWSKIQQQQQQQRRRWKKQKQTSSFALVIMYDTQRFANTMALTLRIWK